MSERDQFYKYYDKFFPYHSWMQWLNHSPAPGPNFMNREFAFTLVRDDALTSDPGIYARYQSFNNVQEFRNKVLALVPRRFEIGAVFTRPPAEHKRLTPDRFKPLRKELVFDIDLTDYDDLRTCCSSKKVCLKCWQFMNVAIEVLDATFRNDFGYEHILWVFSGRRGVHAWICDERAIELSDQQRADLVEYLTVDNHTLAHLGKHVHPMIKRSFEICARHFDQVILCGQDPFRHTQQVSMLIERLKPAGLEFSRLFGEHVTSLLQKQASSREIWAEIDNFAKLGRAPVDTEKLVCCKRALILQYLYPKLDANVSKARNHLLKSPFCVHPDTGSICVPINIKDLTGFDPQKVPNLRKLLEEDELGLTQGKGRLEPYTAQFKAFVKPLNTTHVQVHNKEHMDKSVKRTHSKVAVR